MILYLIIFFVIVFLGFVNLFYKDKSLFVLPYFGLFLLLFSLAAFRFETGPDYPSYEIFFNEVDYNLIGFLEPLFVVTIVFLRDFLGLQYQSLLILLALLAILSKFWFIFKTVDYWFVGLMFYFCNLYLTADFGQIRQGMAISLALIGFYQLANNRLLSFFLFVLLGVGFHFTAIVCFIAPLIVKIQWSKRVMIMTWVVALIVGLLMRGPVLQPIVEVLLPPNIASKVIGYLSGEVASLGLSLGMVLRFLCLILGVNALSSVSDVRFRKYVNLYFFGGIILFLFNFNETFATRLSSFFLALDFILISYSLMSFRYSYYKVAIFSFFVLINFYTLLQQLLPSDSFFVPYKSVFFK